MLLIIYFSKLVKFCILFHHLKTIRITSTHVNSHHLVHLIVFHLSIEVASYICVARSAGKIVPRPVLSNKPPNNFVFFTQITPFRRNTVTIAAIIRVSGI